jgi:alanyl-tRNA synthetase
MGEPDGNKAAWSIELCGGTHVRRTGDIGYFRIVGETAVGAGVRRIEAVTGASAEAVIAETTARLNDAAGALRASPAEVPERIAALLEDRRKLQSQVAELQKKLATGGGAAAAEEVGGVMLSARNLGDVPAKDLKGLADAILKQQGSGVVALVSTAEGKASIVVAVSADLTGRISAVELVRAASAAVGGKGGGGRPDLAQAGGPDGARADEALAAVRAALG